MKIKSLKTDWELWISGIGKVIMQDCTYLDAVDHAEGFGLPYGIKQINRFSVRREEDAVAKRKRIV